MTTKAESSNKLPTPLLLPTCFWLGGVLTGFFFYWEDISNYYLLVIVPAVVILSALFLLFKKTSIKLIPLLVLVFILAYTHTSFSQHKPSNHIRNFLDRDTSLRNEIVMRINSPLQIRESQFGKQYYLTGIIERLGDKAVTGRMIITFPPDYLLENKNQLAIGSRITTVAQIFPYKQAHSFSRIPAGYYRSNKTPDVIARARSLVEVLEPPNKGLITNIYLQYRKAINQAHLFLAERIETRIAPQHAPFLKAILLGERTDLHEEREVFQKAGLSHLLAISGLHLSIITLVIITVLNNLRIPRKLSIILTIIIIISYAELCAWTPSISRAALMISILLMTKVLQRSSCSNNALLASLIIITAVNPAQIFSIGLQLSFICVFVIVNVYGLVWQFMFELFSKVRLKEKPLTKRDVAKYRQKKLLQFMDKPLLYLLQVVIMALLLSVALAPLTLFYFNNVSFNGIIANMFAIPLVTLIIPITLLHIIVPPFFEPVFVYQHSVSFLMNVMNAWTKLCASFPFYWGFVPFPVLKMFFLFAALILLYIKLKEHLAGYKVTTIKDTPKPTAPDVKDTPSEITDTLSKDPMLKKRWKPWLHYTVIAILLALVFLPIFPQSKNQLKVTMFDVGHADLFLIETPSKETILIDTGPRSDKSVHIRNSALPYFQQNGIKTIDWLVITHPHDDHYGGFEWAVDNLKINNVVITEHFKASTEHLGTSTELKKIAIHLTNVPNIIVVADTTHLVGLSLRNKIIHPDKHYTSDNVNNMSLVLKFEYQNVSFLFTGDIEFDAETYLTSNYPYFLESTVLKIPHHGSNSSSTEQFLSLVDPEIVLISAPTNNNHFPSPNTLEKLSHLPNENIFSTGIDGTVQIITDGFTIKSNKTQPLYSIK